MPMSEYCRDPANLYSPECMLGANPGTYDPLGNISITTEPGNVLQSPSTVWTGTGIYSRTLQSILSGLALWRGAQAVPTATQLIRTTPQQVVIPGYGEPGNVPAGGRPGTNFSGQFQALIERHPGFVALGVGGFALLLVGMLKKPKRGGYY